MKYYCLDENDDPGTLSSRFIGCQNLYQPQNLKILLIFQGHKNPHEQNFWNLIFFYYLNRQGYHSKDQLVVTLSLYINFIMKLLIKSYLLAQKQGKS